MNDSTVDSSSSNDSFNAMVQKTRNNIRFAHFNVQSMRNKIDRLQTECEQYDVIGLSETWLNENIKDDNLKLEGFNGPYRRDRPDGWGGVAIYTRKELNCKPRPDLYIPDLEGIWCEIRHNKLKFLVSCIYRPPNSRRDYWDKIKDSIEGAKLSSPGTNIVLMGDLNCDINKGPNQLNNIMNNFNLTQLIKDHTHVTKTSRTLIDIIACTCPADVKSSGTVPSSLSDHNGIYACIGKYYGRNKSYKREIWLFDKANWDEINTDINNGDWSDVTENADINTACNNLTNKYLKILKKHIPNKTVTIRSRDKPWMKNIIRKAQRRRNRAYKSFKRSNTEEDWQEYTHARNRCNEEVSNAKKEYEADLALKLLNNDANDNKLWWKTVKYFNGDNSNDSDSKSPLMENDKCITDDLEKAELFNEYFVKQSTIEETEEECEKLKSPIIPENTLNEIQIDEQTVKDILKNLKPNKASGPDRINPRTLKKTAEALSPILVKFFNKCLEMEQFPDKWKLANIIPIHKKGSHDQVGNFRPISLLSCLGKVFERCVAKYLLNFFKDHKIISRAQAAYIGEGSSTITQLIEIYHQIMKNLDEGKDVHFVFCDASKAFDRVWHKGLLYKLEQCGVTGKMHNWFSNYLSNRQQRVVVNGSESKYKSITAGVPQGSILGPIMFLIYINDLPEGLISNVKLYADDTSLFVSEKNPENATRELAEDLNRISEWSTKWKVKMNPDKTERLVISRKRHLHVTDLRMDDQTVKNVSEHKHLGLTIQSNGKWSSHIKETIAKAQRKVDILRSLMYKLDRPTLEKMYISFIRPILEYGNIIWANCQEHEKKEIEDVQLDAARVVTGAVRGTSHEVIYKDCGWETLEKRRERQQMCMLYKIVNGQVPETLSQILPMQIQDRLNYNLRQGHNLVGLRTRTNAFKNSFIPATIKLWNNLDVSVRNSITLSDFKKKISGIKFKIKERYITGPKKGQIMLNRIRMGHSGLHQHLKNNHIQDEEACECGYGCENPHHYLFDCTHHTGVRQIMLDKLPGIQRNVAIFINGDDNQSEKINKSILGAVTTFIVQSNRF